MNLDQAKQLAELALRFGRVERATWHPDGRPETDTDHTVMLGWIAMELVGSDHNYSPGRIARLVLVHDMVEVVSGDTNTLGASAEALEAKRLREAAALEALRKTLGPWSMLLETLDQYEAQACRESRLVKLLDKVVPKLTHALNGAAPLRARGVTPAELRAMHAKQRNALWAQFSDLPDVDRVFALLDAAMAAAVEALEGPSPATEDP